MNSNVIGRLKGWPDTSQERSRITSHPPTTPWWKESPIYYTGKINDEWRDARKGNGNYLVMDGKTHLCSWMTHKTK